MDTLYWRNMMNDHDPLCATHYWLHCDCGSIAVIRADEREKIMAQMDADIIARIT